MDREDLFGEVFNIGSTEEVTILDLARAGQGADRHRGPRSSAIPYDEAYEEGFEDMARRVPDTSKIQAAIGWQPARNLGEILADVVAQERSAAVPQWVGQAA